jgi:hypothetical protein
MLEQIKKQYSESDRISLLIRHAGGLILKNGKYEE